MAHELINTFERAAADGSSKIGNLSPCLARREKFNHAGAGRKRLPGDAEKNLGKYLGRVTRPCKFWRATGGGSELI